MKQLLVLIAIIFAVGCDNPTTPENFNYYTDEAGDQLKLYESGRFEWNNSTGKYVEITNDITQGKGNPYEHIYLFNKDTVWIMLVNYEGEDLAYVSTNGTAYITYKKQ